MHETADENKFSAICPCVCWKPTCEGTSMRLHASTCSRIKYHPRISTTLKYILYCVSAEISSSRGTFRGNMIGILEFD